MQLMIKYSKEEFDNVKKCFQDLEYLPDHNKIIGKIIIGPCHYIKKEIVQGRFQWIIKPCDEDQAGMITGEYLILIDLNLKGDCNTGAKVWEVGEKIERLAKSLGKPLMDLHLYPQDKSCCLGIKIEDQQISLSSFILNEVYPYFVWQAYYAKYEKVPPCGEYSHGKKGLEEATQDYKSGMVSVSNLGRNEKCPCGSIKKYKKCCLGEDQRKKSSLLKWENENKNIEKLLKKIRKMELQQKELTNDHNRKNPPTSQPVA